MHVERLIGSLPKLAAAIAAASTILLLGPTSDATAARPPDPVERSAIATLIPGLTTECADILISTVDETWGTVGSTNASGCLQGDGFVVVSREVAGWYIFMQSAGDACPLPDLHTSVTADLQLCPPISALPYFYSFIKNQLVIKPRSLGQGAHGFYEKIRWRKWSHSQARGRGVFNYQDRTLTFRIAVRIRLYGARTCLNGVRLFTRRKVTAVHKKNAKRIRFDSRYTSYGKCSENQYSPIP